MSSSHYPSFYSHHYEQCDEDVEEELLEVLTKNRFTRFGIVSLLSIQLKFNSLLFIKQPTNST